MRVNIGRLVAWAAGGVVAVTLAIQLASAQVAVPAAPAAPPVPKVPSTAPVEGAVDTAREAAREAREATRERAEEARDTAKGARREAREAGREAREAGREVGREVREDARVGGRNVRNVAQEIDSLRAADIGLWFSGRGGPEGLLVADVAADGAIAKIGFQEGDRIVSINDQKVTSEGEFMAFLRDEQIRDQRVKVVVLRGGRETVLNVTPAMIYREAVVYDPLWRYGLVIDDRYPDRVVILRVFPRTPAYYAGLRAGDVVVGVRGQRIARVADFVNAFTTADGRFPLQVTRANRTRDLEIDASAEAGARTALKPQVDPETRIDGRGRVERLENRPDLPADSPRIEKPRPNEPATPSRLGTPEKPAAPEKPAVPAPRPGEAALPAPAADAPALPPAPTAPRAPAVPAPPKP